MLSASRTPTARALTILVVAGFTACSGARSMRSAPAALGGLPLHHEFTGPRALAAIRQLHGAGHVEIVGAWVAGYGDEHASGMLYVGIASNHAGAQQLLQDMERRVASQPTPFQDLHRITVAGRDVGMLSGQGQLHFLYVVGPRVVWLSIDRDRACAALKQLLGHAPGEDTPGGCRLDAAKD